MNTIKTINDSNIEMLNESIVERHASMLISTLRENNFTLKTFFKNVSYIPKFEELDASCVTVHRRIDASLTKQIKNIIKEAGDDKNDAYNIMLIFVKKRKPVVIEWHKNLFYIYNNLGKYWDVEQNKIYNALGRRRNKTSNWTEVLCDPEYVDEIWEFDFSGLNTAELKRSRREAKEGMILMTDESFKEIAEKNRARYKILAQEMRNKKGEVFNHLMTDAMSVIQQALEFTSQYQRNIPKYVQTYKTVVDNKYDEKFFKVIIDCSNNLQRMMEEINIHTSTLITRIGNNISNQEEIISSPYNREYYVKRVDTQNEYVQDTITKLNDSIKKAENYMREMDELLK